MTHSLADEVDSIANPSMLKSAQETRIGVSFANGVYHGRPAGCVRGEEKAVSFGEIAKAQRCPQCFDQSVMTNPQLMVIITTYSYLQELEIKNQESKDLAGLAELIRQLRQHINFLETIISEQPVKWVEALKEPLSGAKQELMRLEKQVGSPEHREAMRLWCSEKVGTYGGVYLAAVRKTRNRDKMMIAKGFQVMEAGGFYLIEAPGEVMEYLEIEPTARVEKIQESVWSEETLEGALVLYAEGGIYSDLTAALDTASAL